MLRRLQPVILLAAALGIVYAGPVAACVCADGPVTAMPCCPDDAQPPGDANHHAPAEVDIACDPLSAEALLPSVPDIPQTVAVSSELPPWLTVDPPERAAPAYLPRYGGPPIYLVTLRLRN